MDYIPGMIIMAGWNYVPTNWLLCDGSVYPANSYQGLFNVIGNTYGGNSGKTFAVPNLSYRMPLGAGPMPASAIVFSLGQQGGAAARTLTPANISNHIHVNTACQFTPPTISAQCGNAQLYMPYTTAPADALDTLINGAYLAKGQSAAGAVNMYSSKGSEGLMDSGPIQVPLAIAPVALDIEFTATVPSGVEPVATLPPVIALKFFICCAPNSSS